MTKQIGLVNIFASTHLVKQDLSVPKDVDLEFSVDSQVRWQVY
jgi:hypothetical protein